MPCYSSNSLLVSCTDGTDQHRHPVSHRGLDSPLIVLISLQLGTFHSFAVPVQLEVRSIDESGEKRREERARVSPIWDPKLEYVLSSLKMARRTSMSRPSGSETSARCFSRRFLALGKGVRTTSLAFDGLAHRSSEYWAMCRRAFLRRSVPSV